MKPIFIIASMLVIARAVAGPAGAEPANADNALPAWNKRLLQKPADWYPTPQARHVAANVIRHQSAEGGWPKNTNLAAPPGRPGDIHASSAGMANTIDNDATTLPMRFLARFTQITGDQESRAAFLRGFNYLLSAQYPNGGWPQYHPLRKGYYSHITFNDHAMVNVLNLLLDVSRGLEPFDFVDDHHRQLAAAAVQRGVVCILRTQILQNGRPTAWCAQHDAMTLAPAQARAYEPPSLSGNESVGIVRFLMRLESSTPGVIEAIEGAVAWFRSVGIDGMRVESFTNPNGERDRRVVADATAPTLWARFYELETNRPLFVDRDMVPRDSYHELSIERRTGYSYYGNWPAALLEKEYPQWRRDVRGD
jgi:PelA/Pel-15E family pectate lyase